MVTEASPTLRYLRSRERTRSVYVLAFGESVDDDAAMILELIGPSRCRRLRDALDRVLASVGASG